jgi:hypothetical protein
LQYASSIWNCSKDLPGPGNTMMLGPCGTVAHPATAINTKNKKNPRIFFIESPILSYLGNPKGQKLNHQLGLRLRLAGSVLRSSLSI